MADHPIQGLMSTAMQKIRELVDVNTIVGDPITAPDGTVLIPVSKVSFGFVAGGSDLPSSLPKNLFAGGSGAGISIKPEAFIVISSNGEVKMLHMKENSSPLDSLISGAPELINKVKEIFGNKDD